MIYSFKNPDDPNGPPIELVMTVAEMESKKVPGEDFTIEHEGRILERDLRAEHKPARCNWSKPLLSEGAGVHPSQIDDARAFNASRGLDTDYAKDGRAIFKSPQHRNRHLKAWGMHDKDGVSG